jgi:hypothetical protein
MVLKQNNKSFTQNKNKMKIYKKWQVFIAFVLLFSAVGCTDLLEEDSVSLQTADSYYTTEDGFEDLVRSIYPLYRDIIQQRALVLRGTDEFSAGSWANAEIATTYPVEDAYDQNFGPSFEPIETLWNLLYREVNRANTVITRAESVVGMDAGLKEDRVAEAKVMRSLALFYAVQQWGDVPMPLVETTGANKEVIRVPAADVYAQLISDLTAAEATLPVASDFGRATKGVAQFLLSRVHLTRGWNFAGSLGGTTADFNLALSFADKVIAGYPLAANYNDLFPKRVENPTLETNNPGTQDAQNNEIVFAVQFNENPITNAGDDTNGASIIGNDYHSIFGGGADDAPGSVARSSDYNRYLNKFAATPTTYRLYDPAMDTRHDHNWVDALYAITDAPGFIPADGVAPIDIAAGDVVVEYRPWNNPATTAAERGLDIPGGTMPYAVINNDEYGRINANSNYHNNNKYPLLWRFWEPNIPYGDGEGTFDFALFRSAEAYLLAAEAIVKGASGGALGGADAYMNAVVDRALGANAGADPMQASVPEDVTSLVAKSYRATGAVTIDMILDERSRELMGEYNRWYDLKRTETLIDRTMKHNPWTKASGSISAKHYLRPIPQQEIDLASNDLSQNAGY